MLRVVVLAAALYGITSASTPPEPLRIDTLAGSNSNGDGGPASAAVFQNLEGVAADPLGNIFVADTDAHVVRRISPSGVVRTVAGNGRAGLSGDGGQGPLASLNLPYGIAADLAGNLYIADLGNARVRKLAPDGVITTIAGHTAETRLAAPRNVAVDAAGTVYISDFGGHRIYKLTGSAMTPIAGNGRQGKNPQSACATGVAAAHTCSMIT